MKKEKSSKNDDFRVKEPSKKLYLDEIEDRDEKNRLERENLFKKIKGE